LKQAKSPIGGVVQDGNGASVNGQAARRLDSFRRLLVHLRESLSLDLGFVLWDGSTVPADLPPEELAIAFADEGVIASLIRRPNLHTILNLLVTGRVDIRGGWISDLVSRRSSLRTREIIRRLDKRLALATALKFLFTPRGGPWPLEAVHGDQARTDGSEEANKANVSYHYDLSNDFYALLLDPEMVYSCGYYQDWNNDLATAQHDKLDMICRKLRLKPGDSFLDIGCGWGGLVCHAAKYYGVQAHGVTLAEEQFAYAREKVARLGLQDKVTLELRDYAQIDSGYDKIASIGMFEHVGLANHPTYFQTINRLLKPGGLYLHHAITYRWRDFERVRRDKPQVINVISRYIFPGGELDHIGLSVTNLERHGFEVHDVEGWREHYARTTRLWRDQLATNREAAEREVGGVKTRLWLTYLDGASAGFNHGSLGIFQTLASKRVRGPTGLPPTRADLYR
jgi:cyclopropane-fatty-acyl-phospholipid synthase